MRLCRLDLLRYGCFTEKVIELPAHNPDLHIVFGPNEAGKSTALSALEDFLFGIPHNSVFNFLHDYGSMRIGGILKKANGETLEAHRRKGQKDTLLTPDSVSISAGEGALATFLAGADRSFFERMFSLDHNRLRRGGREILEARDEIGQVLFAVGSGISGLRDRSKALEDEADALWASRRATHRKFYQAEDRLKIADEALRERTVTATTWQELKRAWEGAEEAYDVLEKEIQGRVIELRKLGRIRRVSRNVGRKSQLEADIAILGEVKLLPEDIQTTLGIAERDDAHAVARIETLSEQLATAHKEREALTYDEALLRREEDIQQLREHRIQVRAGRADLPKRRAELANAEASLQRRATELNWQTAELTALVARIPTRSKVTGVRTLLSHRGKLRASLDSAETALEEAKARFADLEEQLAEVGAALDVTKLAATIKSIRESGDLVSRMEAAENEKQEAERAIVRHLTLLKPPVSNEEVLISKSVPPKDTIQTHRDNQRDLYQVAMIMTDGPNHACRWT